MCKEGFGHICSFAKRMKMNKLMPSNGNTRWSVFSIIILSWLLVGTLDICSAFLHSYLKRGTMPGAILRYIASTAFGKDRFTDPKIANIAGLLVHYSIALGWTILFFFLYRRFRWMQKNVLATGIGYGFFIWAFMNILLLPVWNNKAYVFKAEPAIVNALILMAAIGLPLALLAKKKIAVN